MARLQAIEMEDGTVIFVETVEEIEVPEVVEEAIEQEVRRGGEKGASQNVAKAASQVSESFVQIQNTVKTYTKYTLNAFRDAALADVKKVTLEFGVNVSGEGGVPYIATGTVGCNLKITVECGFPERNPPIAPPQPMQTVPRQPQPNELPPVPRQSPPGGTPRSANSESANSESV